jgi:serine/threonine protein kinase
MTGSVFISYSHKDEVWKDQFVRQLLVLELEGLLEVWEDRRIAAGDGWRTEIDTAIERAKVAVLLVSADFLTSGFIRGTEVPRLLAERAANGLRVIPLILRPCPWRRVRWLAEIQSRPQDGRPLAEGSAVQIERDLSELAEEIADLLQGTGMKDPTNTQDEAAPVTDLSPPMPEPRHRDDVSRGLTVALENAFRRKEEMAINGGDTKVVDQEILELHRALREGGRLKGGDFLAGGRFRLGEALRRGGFATVWKAYDRRQNALVAVKVLHGQFGEDKTRLDRFFRGARKMGELNHPGIVQVRESRLEDGVYYFFVMEYVPGGDLRQAVLEKRLSPDQALLLLREVAAALQFAHEKGIIHRDVKPANILLDATGKPKLADFDLVRAFDTTGGTLLGGGMMGTFLYTAPEVMQEPGTATCAADVYSLAMTVAFCIAGKDLSLEVLENREAFLQKLTCSGRIRAALRRAMAPVEKRFGSVAEFAQALDSGPDAPVLAKHAGPEKRYRTGEECPEHGSYTFDGYLDGIRIPIPPKYDRFIRLKQGQIFPPLRHSNEACWWKFDYSSPDDANFESLELVRLTAREIKVLQLVAQGLSNEEIGHLLGISESTVKSHVSAILRKLGARGRTDAAMLGVRLGLLPGSSE